MTRRDHEAPRPSGPLTACAFRADFAAYSDDNLVLAADLLDPGKVENVSDEHHLMMFDAAARKAA